MSDNWTAEQIPDQSGRVALVTGANSGLGLITARELARAGAQVVMTARDMDKGAAALNDVNSTASGPQAELAELDLASLDSVRSFAEEFKRSRDGLDLLINNAGVMAPPRRTTSDGFELQLGTNHLGHFALTGLLLGTMEGREGARVVTVTSTAHRMGKINFDDLQSEGRYSRWRAYGQSKLSNLLFAFELDRRLRAAGSTVSSLAAHPGYSATNLQSAAPPAIDRAVMAVSNRLLAQDAEIGALPQLYAATQPGLEGGTFVGPDGRGEQRGHPQPNARATSAARDEETARRLWEVSEELTGVHYDLPAPAGAER
jgi:NAD(P)-dependent dehydrogenase (short-subunit alcohol dehydrogenase family)